MSPDYTLNLKSAGMDREYGAAMDRIAAELSAGAKVLDWGCGWGQISRGLLDRGVDVTSFDYRPKEWEPDGPEESGLAHLARFPDIEAYIERHDPVRLPYDDSAFDAVVSMGVLEHVADPDASLEELKRVLRPGGKLYVYKLPNRFSYTEKLGKLAGNYVHGDLPDDRLYTVRSARRLLQRHGFGILELRRANMLPLNRLGAARPAVADAWWRANRALAAVPGLNLLSTNVELVAVAPAT